MSIPAHHWLWIPVLLLGAALRFLDLSSAPLHADEAVGAKITAGRLEGRGYSFDPSHYHGPSLSLIASWSGRLAGEKSFEDLDILTLRGVAALCGSLIILLPLLLRRWLGKWVRSRGLYFWRPLPSSAFIRGFSSMSHCWRFLRRRHWLVSVGG